MINKTLLARECRANYKLLLIFGAVLTLYIAVIISMFDPELGAGLDMMMESMAELFAAFGMQNPGSTLLEFLINYLYGFLLILFPMLFTIMLANRLVVRYVDQGSMVYLINTPNKRSRIVRTQAFVLIAALVVLIVYVTLLTVIVSQISFPGSLAAGKLAFVNIGLFCLHIFLGGICFLSSCFFNDTRSASGVSAGLCIAFFLIQMLSQIGDELEFLKYATPLTLFQPTGIAASESSALVGMAILLVSGVIFIAAGIVHFAKKDLCI